MPMTSSSSSSSAEPPPPSSAAPAPPPPPPLPHRPPATSISPPTPPPFSSHNLNPNNNSPNTNHPSVVFPVAASGRGFNPRNLRTDHGVTVPKVSVSLPKSAENGRPFGFQRPDNVPSLPMRPPSVHTSYVIAPRPIPSPNPAPPRSAPALALPLNPKVSQAPTVPSTSDFNNQKDSREKKKDDAVVTIHDRKVRLSDAGSSGSLYALCRSWVRNGLPQITQPQIGEGIKLLPRPLPTTVADTRMLKRNDRDGEDELSSKEKQDGSVENLSARDLLMGHIKHAKKVRTRLREERLQRIDRYRQRLSLLLPPPLDQCRNDASNGS